MEMGIFIFITKAGSFLTSYVTTGYNYELACEFPCAHDHVGALL